MIAWIYQIVLTVSGVPESQAVAGNSTVHIGTWESHIVPDRSFQQAEEARRKYGDMAVGPGHIRGVNGVEPCVLNFTDSPAKMTLDLPREFHHNSFDECFLSVGSADS